MNINGHEITATHFAFDGCHKIYILDNDEKPEDTEKFGYQIFPIAEIKAKYRASCPLRFISNWNLDKNFVRQGEKASFKVQS